MKFEKNLKLIRKLDLDMIWDHDRYVKASPGSTLQSSNNGLTISYDLGRKSGIFWASKQIRFKKRFWHFFENYRKSMSRSKISSWNHSESKEHIRNIFPSYLYEGRISKNEKSIFYFKSSINLKKNICLKVARRWLVNCHLNLWCTRQRLTRLLISITI